MFNLIYSELLKLRRSHIFTLILLGAVLIPFIQYFVLIDMNNEAVNEDLKILALKSYIENVNILQIPIINMSIITLVSSFIFVKEFTNKTLNVLYSYPVSRIKIFFGKFITIYILSLLLYLANFIAIISFAALSSGADGFNIIFFKQLKISLFSVLMQVFVIPIGIFIASVTKSMVIPAIYGVLSGVFSVFSFSICIYMQFVPINLPSISIDYFIKGDPIDYIACSITAGVTFILFLTLCIFYWKKADIS